MAARSLMCLLTQQKEQLQVREQDLTKYFLSSTIPSSSMNYGATLLTSGNSGISDRRLSSGMMPAKNGGIPQSKENEPPTVPFVKHRTRRALFQEAQKNPPVISQVDCSKDCSNELGSTQTLFDVLGGMAPIDAMIDQVYCDGSLNIRLKYFLKRFMVRALNGPGRITSISLQVTYNLLIHDRGMDPNCIDKLAGTVCRVLKEKGSPSVLLTEVSTAILNLQEEIIATGSAVDTKNAPLKMEENISVTQNNGGKNPCLNSIGSAAEEEKARASPPIVNCGCVAQSQSTGSSGMNTTTTILQPEKLTWGGDSTTLDVRQTVSAKQGISSIPRDVSDRLPIQSGDCSRDKLPEQAWEHTVGVNASTLAKEILGNFSTHVSKYFEQKAQKREVGFSAGTKSYRPSALDADPPVKPSNTHIGERLSPQQYVEATLHSSPKAISAVTKVIPEATKPLPSGDEVKLSSNPITMPYDALKDRRRRRRQLQQSSQVGFEKPSCAKVKAAWKASAAVSASAPASTSTSEGGNTVTTHSRHSSLLQILCEQNRQQQQQQQPPQPSPLQRPLDEPYEISIPATTIVQDDSRRSRLNRTDANRKSVVSFVLPVESAGVFCSDNEKREECVDIMEGKPHYHSQKPPELNLALIEDVGLDMEFMEADHPDPQLHVQPVAQQQLQPSKLSDHERTNPTAILKVPVVSHSDNNTNSSSGSSAENSGKGGNGIVFPLHSGSELEEIMQLWSHTGPRGFHITKVEKILNLPLYETFIRNQSSEAIQGCFRPQNLKWHGSKDPYAVVQDGFLIRNISNDGSVWFHNDASYAFIYNASVLLLAAVRPGVSYRDGRHQCFVETDMYPAYVVTFKIGKS